MTSTSTPDVAQLWSHFMSADEVAPVQQAYDQLVEALALREYQGLDCFVRLRDKAATANYGMRRVFDHFWAFVERKNAGVDVSLNASREMFVSGAGPCGLRAAVELAALGFKVTVVEKRTTFSRVNILSLWGYTMNDLIACGAKIFYPQLRTTGDNLCLGTREIQLTLLKFALLLGVKVYYGTVLSAIQAPDVNLSTEKWKAWITPTHAPKTTMDALGFKPNKQDDYQKTFKCNMLQETPVDPEFLLAMDQPAPVNATASHNFDTLFLAEGEWSHSVKALGITKTIDKFANAIGLVLNLGYRKDNAVEKRLQSFQNIVMGAGITEIANAGIKVENVEYLKLHTHYIVVTIPKKVLLQHRVLKEDKPTNKELLVRDNLDSEQLEVLSRKIATACGLPEDTPFYEHNPMQMFDFSTRARCVVPFRVLGVGMSGEHQLPLCFNTEAQPALAAWDVLYHQQLSETLQGKIATIEKQIEELGAPPANYLDEDTQKQLYIERETEREKLRATKTQLEADMRDAQQKALDYATLAEEAATSQRRVAVYPIGDAAVEPFWPQGLGANRGFHVSLDAVDAALVEVREGLNEALLVRSFAYDLVKLGWSPRLLQPESGWKSDISTRYQPDLRKMVALSYLDPLSKRSQKGIEAVPVRFRVESFGKK